MVLQAQGCLHVLQYTFKFALGVDVTGSANGRVNCAAWVVVVQVPPPPRQGAPVLMQGMHLSSVPRPGCGNGLMTMRERKDF